MQSLTELAEHLYFKWDKICVTDYDAAVMAQINAIVIHKDNMGQKRSDELGIPFRIEGDSHWKMNDLDHEMFQKYFKKHPNYNLVKYVVGNGSKGSHVETLRHIFDTFKED